MGASGEEGEKVHNIAAKIVVDRRVWKGNASDQLLLSAQEIGGLHLWL